MNKPYSKMTNDELWKEFEQQLIESDWTYVAKLVEEWKPHLQKPEYLQDYYNDLKRYAKTYKMRFTEVIAKLLKLYGNEEK